MPERSNGHAWKACVPSRVPRVRIPVSPHFSFCRRFFSAKFFPFSYQLHLIFARFCRVLLDYDKETIIAFLSLREHQIQIFLRKCRLIRLIFLFFPFTVYIAKNFHFSTDFVSDKYFPYYGIQAKKSCVLSVNQLKKNTL